MQINRKLVLQILEYLKDNKDFYFPFKIMYKNNDGDYIEISIDDYNNLLNDKKYNNFELWENLQNLTEETIKLMSKGFIEKIIQKNLLNEVECMAIEYRKTWKEELCDSVKIEEYGFNEFLGGKAEGFEESVEIIKKYLN